MKVTDEMLMALADHELDQKTAAALRQQIAQSPQLQEKYAQFESDARVLRAAIDLGPVPEHLIRTIEDALPPHAQPQAPVQSTKIYQFRRPAPRRIAIWGSIAAGLALAFFAGSMLQRPVDEPGFDLATAAQLPTGASIPLPDGSTLRAIASYDSDQGLCRTLLHDSAATRTRQVICQDDGHWHVALTLSAPNHSSYIPASDPLTTSLDAYLDAIGAGLPMEADEEKARHIGGKVP